MDVKVHMLAFCEKGTIRIVNIPNMTEDCNDVDKILNDTFYFGQNDFQSLNCPSVSVGDVIEYKNKFYRVEMIGFNEVKPKFVKSWGK